MLHIRYSIRICHHISISDGKSKKFEPNPEGIRKAFGVNPIGLRKIDVWGSVGSIREIFESNPGFLASELKLNSAPSPPTASLNIKL